jgi:hypothetical protein
MAANQPRACKEMMNRKYPVAAGLPCRFLAWFAIIRGGSRQNRSLAPFLCALQVLGVILSTLVLLVIVASLAFYHLISAGELRRYLISEIESKTEFKVQLGEADLALGRILGIGFSDFALSEPDAARPAITAQRITARVALLPLFERKLILYGVRLHKPTALLVRDKEGRLPLLEKIAQPAS